MTGIYIGLLVFLAIVAYFFIYVAAKINSLESKARDKGSEIDGGLWDRGFQLGKIIEILDANGIAHDLEPVDVNTFGLGMSPAMQAVYAEKTDKQDEKLRALIKDNPVVAKLSKSEDMAVHYQKFNAARVELAKASKEYNQAANSYNAYIVGFPGSVMAAFHKKSSKSVFGYFFIDYDKLEEKTEEK